MTTRYAPIITAILMLLLISACAQTSPSGIPPAATSISSTASPEPGISPQSGTKGAWAIINNGNSVNKLPIKGDELWAATTGGVCKWDMEKKTYQGISVYEGSRWQSFTTKMNGIADDLILSILKRSKYP